MIQLVYICVFLTFPMVNDKLEMVNPDLFMLWIYNLGYILAESLDFFSPVINEHRDWLIKLSLIPRTIYSGFTDYPCDPYTFILSSLIWVSIFTLFLGLISKMNYQTVRTESESIDKVDDDSVDSEYSDDSVDSEYSDDSVDSEYSDDSVDSEYSDDSVDSEYSDDSGDSEYSDESINGSEYLD